MRNKINLTPAEMGKLWATYMGNTLGICTLSFFLRHVDDEDIKNVLEHALSLSEEFMQDIKQIFIQDNFPIPIGFTDEDVNLESPRLFYDEFYLHYLKYLGKAGMSIYSVAIPLITRRDIRYFFMKALSKTSKLISEVNDVLISKGKLANLPPMESPEKASFVTKQAFLNDFLGHPRPLHGLEVAHLHGCIKNDTTSKALIIGFNQGAKQEKIKRYLERGEKINQNHVDWMSKKLNECNIPSPPLLDHLVTTSTTPTFSEKLVVFHKIDMFSMKIREYANGASLNGRKDIGGLYAKCQIDVSMYAEDGANILIDHGWMEQPPLVIDRDYLSKKNNKN